MINGCYACGGQFDNSDVWYLFVRGKHRLTVCLDCMKLMYATRSLSTDPTVDIYNVKVVKLPPSELKEKVEK